jgi:hypothetical protein
LNKAKIIAGAAGALALGGGLVGAAFSPGPPKRRDRIRTAIEDLSSNGRSAEDVVEWLMNEEHGCEE